MKKNILLILTLSFLSFTFLNANPLLEVNTKLETKKTYDNYKLTDKYDKPQNLPSITKKEEDSVVNLDVDVNKEEQQIDSLKLDVGKKF